MKIISLLILINILCCTRNTNEEQYKVYNDVFIELYGRDNLHVPFNHILKLDSLTQDSIHDDFVSPKNRPIDNRRLIVGIHDCLTMTRNLFMLPNYNFTTKKVNYKISNYGRSFKKFESKLIKKLYKINKHSEPIQIEKINNTGRFELLKSSEVGKLIDKDFFEDNIDSVCYQANIILSKVAFDETMKNGCFLYHQIDNGGHGHPILIFFVQKIENKWEITHFVE
ncbi:hypothetical protein [Tenacibaculum ovolyticum]|uniref:hypothetical protein n=1 Tax=Tenacibaculum ovolyticum TaxID=104270 RepID=UPI001F18B9D3|nr:hypothetical protein [Tenacibaculum ovolyticum]